MAETRVFTGVDAEIYAFIQTEPKGKSLEQVLWQFKTHSPNRVMGALNQLSSRERIRSIESAGGRVMLKCVDLPQS